LVNRFGNIYDYTKKLATKGSEEQYCSYIM